MNLIRKSWVVISLLFVFTFQIAILYAEQSDPNLVNSGGHQPPILERSGPTDSTNPGPGPRILPLPEFLPGDDIHPLTRPDKPGPGPILKLLPPDKIIKDIKPLPIKPILPPPDVPRPEVARLEELAREYALQTSKKKIKKEKRTETKTRATNPKILKANSDDSPLKVLDLQFLATAPESIAFKAILDGLDKNMEISALLRSSADTDLADHRIFGVDCKNNSCTGLVRDLDAATSYFLSFLVKAPDTSEELFYELVSRNIEAHSFSTPALPTEEILAKVKEIFLQERPEQQIPLDESSVEVSDLETGCTAVAVCPKRSYNVTAKSQDGNDRIVGTIALFGGSAKRYVSNFRLQRKSSSLSSPLKAGTIGL